jgi:hypothetical protein
MVQEKRVRVSTEILSALKRWGRPATTTTSGNDDNEGTVGDGVSLEDIELAQKGAHIHTYVDERHCHLVTYTCSELLQQAGFVM